MTRPFPEVEGVEHRFVDAGGLRMHVAEAGEGDPLLLVHGWPQHWYEWRELIPRLAPRFRVICPDLRGMGWSDAPRSGYEKEQLASDLLALLDALGLERVRYVGHDWGGWVGWLTCFRAPERIERFVALNIPHPWNGLEVSLLPELWRFWYQWFIASPGLGEWVLRNRPAFTRRLLTADNVNPDTWTGEELAQFVDALREPERARASVQYYRTFVLREFPALVRGRYESARLTVPTLLLFGERDFAISKKLLDGYEPHADDMRVERVPDSGHFIVNERPELVAERTLEFLS